MAKLGVGIGEEFPMDDSAGPDEEALRRRREWARRKQAFADFWSKVKIAARESFGEDWDHYAGRFSTIRWWPYGAVLVACGVLFVIFLASAVFAAVLTAAPVLLATGVMFVLMFRLYRKRYGHGDPPRPDVIVTPPPAQS
jgi:Flp pilus assembly protein TadB